MVNNDSAESFLECESFAVVGVPIVETAILLLDPRVNLTLLRRIAGLQIEPGSQYLEVLCTLGRAYIP
jgi:hypothetical protein